MKMDAQTWEDFVEQVEEMIFMARETGHIMVCIDFEHDPALRPFEKYQYGYRTKLVTQLRKDGHKIVVKNTCRDGIVDEFIVDFT